MGILVDSRLYMLLAIISIVVGLGFILYLARIARDRTRLTSFQWWALSLLLLILVLVAAEHIFYNLKFIQHQGRYLFPALVPIGLAFALGLQEWVNTLVRLISRFPSSEPIAAPLNHIGKGLAFSLFYTGFLALDLVCLYRFIVPYFQG